MTVLKAALVKLVLSFWAALHPGLDEAADAREVAEGIAAAVADDAENAPVFTSHAEDAATAAYWAFKETSLQKGAVGDRGLAHGIFQFHVPAEELGDVRAQTARWLELLRQGRKYCPEHPAAMTWGACRQPYVALADRRVARVREVLSRVLQDRGEP